MSEDTINQAIQLSKTGRPLDARKLLRPLLEAEPENEKAWLWYANSFDTVEDKIKALKNCLVYCPDSKMANDGIRSLLTKLPKPEPSIMEEASDLAADLQKENVQFNDPGSFEEADVGSEVEFDRPASISTFDDQDAIPDLEDRLQGTTYRNDPVIEGTFEQEETPIVSPDVEIMEPEPTPEDGQKNIIVKTSKPQEAGHPIGWKYRTPFILFTILGVILFIILAIIITILLFSS